MSVGETGFPENTWCASCPFIWGGDIWEQGLFLFFFFFFSFPLDFSGLVMCEYRVPFFAEIPRSKASWCCSSLFRESGKKAIDKNKSMIFFDREKEQQQQHMITIINDQHYYYC